jgi:hypothetical protein
MTASRAAWLQLQWECENYQDLGSNTRLSMNLGQERRCPTCVFFDKATSQVGHRLDTCAPMEVHLSPLQCPADFFASMERILMFRNETWP